MAPSLLAAVSASPFLLPGSSRRRWALPPPAGPDCAWPRLSTTLPRWHRRTTGCSSVFSRSLRNLLVVYCYRKSAVKFERYLMGEILSVGADVSEVEAGKKVLFSDINAYEVDLDTDEKHCFCRESDLLAVVE
uniref:CHL-CPN10 n=1 Tax=Zea mays TaxID=4577 RepID=B6T3W7_MAIZE|nr:CHL-CPN10 [Zea mays]